MSVSGAEAGLDRGGADVFATLVAGEAAGATPPMPSHGVQPGEGSPDALPPSTLGSAEVS